MTTRERFLRVLSHKEPDRGPFWDYAWGSAYPKWHKEGLPENCTSLGDYYKFYHQ